MTILRAGEVPLIEGVSGYPEPYNLGRGHLSYRQLSDAGGLTRFGAMLQVLHPGRQSSQMHWESHEDEFLLVIEGALTVIEDGEETVLSPGDACAWRAGVPVAHCLRNHTDAPATYLIVGSRDPENVTTYPGLDMLATRDGVTHLDGTPYPRKGD